jgi:hypothetical protein
VSDLERCPDTVGHNPHAWGGPDGGGLEWCYGADDPKPCDPFCNLSEPHEVCMSYSQMLDAAAEPDPINSPAHYTWLGGIEVIDITEHLGFCLGNVVKYVCRADHKGKPIEDLEKAQWYLAREIARRKR